MSSGDDSFSDEDRSQHSPRAEIDQNHLHNVLTWHDLIGVVCISMRILVLTSLLRARPYESVTVLALVVFDLPGACNSTSSSMVKGEPERRSKAPSFHAANNRYVVARS